MIYLDDNHLIERAIESEHAFHVSVLEKNIEAVFLNGQPIRNAYYVDLEKGFLIRIKESLNNQQITIDGQLVHELLMGDVTVKYRE
ncbi:hypothetical protein GPS59_14285 [Acinetobacter haemolyticus]|uniref:hypothetical protein n=1 Tax=Acinetobacter haemolyticus TaxID=29430 RepID=UPI0013734FF5|nr:hypothetical protein [Acinetobacter haemolyticus]NAR50113.1 hypothetical protein [Acinetobacter haemolyticus]NAR55124.1 hypothetical protein [Acinetobacter haemolyticus]